MDIVGVDCCIQLIIAVKMFKEHEDKMNSALAKEEVLVGARNEHIVVVREYGKFNPVVKGIVSAISGDPMHSNQDVFPIPINKPSKKQRDRKIRKLLQEAFGATSTFNSSFDNERSLD